MYLALLLCTEAATSAGLQRSHDRLRTCPWMLHDFGLKGRATQCQRWSAKRQHRIVDPIRLRLTNPITAESPGAGGSVRGPTSVPTSIASLRWSSGTPDESVSESGLEVGGSEYIPKCRFALVHATLDAVSSYASLLVRAAALF